MAYAVGWKPGMTNVEADSNARGKLLENGNYLGYSRGHEQILNRATEKDVIGCLKAACKSLGLKVS